MKVNDYHTKTIEELNTELLHLCKEQFNLRLQKGSGHLPKPDLFKKNRKNIARIKTIIHQKEKGSQV